MSRNHEELEAFQLADALVVGIYKATASFPPEERYGLQSQIRRASVSVPTNLVEGSSRESTREYIRFVEIALGSAQELEYLLKLSIRLRMSISNISVELQQVNQLIRMLQGLLASLRRLLGSPGARSPEPGARGEAP